MIIVTKGQLVPETNYFVKEEGSYEDDALVICEDVNGCEVAFQAYFIQNGNCKGE